MAYTGSQATAGPGFLLDYEKPSDGSWVHVGEVKDINGPDESTDEVDVTNQDSTGGFKEFIATLQDGGNVTFDTNLVPGDTGQQALFGLKHARTIVPWRIQEGDTGYYTHFKGFVNKLGRAFPVGGVMTVSCGIRVSGPVSETQAGS
jgi:predicted secreted protein